MVYFETAAAAGETEFSSLLLSSLHEWATKGWVSFFFSLIYGLVMVLVMRLFVLFVLKMIRRMLERSRRVNNLLAAFLCRVVNVIAWVLIVIWFLGHMGINIAPVLAGLGVTGVILGLAFQETIGNFLSGMMIVFNAPFKIGDYIDSGSFSGTVTDMDMSCVTLTTPDNKRITMSNKLVWSNPIVNYSAMDTRRLDLSASVAYGSDLAKVKAILLSMLSSYPEVLSSPPPTVEVSSLSDSSIDFLVRPWTKAADYWKVTFRFRTEVCDKLAEAGIEVPYNKLDVNVNVLKNDEAFLSSPTR